MGKILAITGMHRSGTSLVANYLQLCGVHIGDTLHPADRGNPRGYYEDVDFLKFHKDLLSFLGLSIFLLEEKQLRSQVPARFGLRAKEIIEKKERYTVWGWKDPRTSLFLDFWQEIIHDLKVLFLLRHPVSVVGSLLRRGTDRIVKRRPSIAFQSWHCYNERILQFYRENRANCFLVDIDDFLRDATGVISRLALKLEIDLSVEKFDTVYAKGVFKNDRDLYDTSLILSCPLNSFRCLRLYRRMKQLADWP